MHLFGWCSNNLFNVTGATGTAAGTRTVNLSIVQRHSVPQKYTDAKQLESPGCYYFTVQAASPGDDKVPQL